MGALDVSAAGLSASGALMRVADSGTSSVGSLLACRRGRIGGGTASSES